MSYWSSIKEKDGSINTILIDIPPGLVIILVGIIAAITIPNMLAAPLKVFSIFSFIACFGLLLFVISKISVLEKGLFLSFGTKSMKPIFKVFYIVGDILIFLGCFGVVTFIALFK
jgi:hypothetical protein